ncbi:MAG: nucleotidyl transferase AbiEii/AbiGii toxin family protein [Geopsychrobacter sp.]|nr:nucleotidyl transferase AbiEii/AbiGii toxin family protein [Geopsychrobacter sp.]
MFERPHHQRIAQVLLTLDGALLQKHNCLFGGGTAIALRFGEYRESVDVDFLISDIDCYRKLRLLVKGPDGITALFREKSGPVTQSRDIRADQYGIRTMLLVANEQIKFEIVLEGRIKLQSPGDNDQVCGVATLSSLDMATTKLLANSDRWADEGVFNRDLIDLAMMQPSRKMLLNAVARAELAYGKAIVNDLGKAVEKFQLRQEWLQRCMQALEIKIPQAVLWEKIRALRRIL